MDDKERKLIKRYEKDIKQYAVVGLGLATISAFILLVDKYLAGTLFWWVVVILSCGGYLYLRIHRDFYWNSLWLGKRKAARYSGPANTFTEPESGRSFSLNDVVKIEIETTGDGPFDEDFYWLFHLTDQPNVRMAGPAAHSQGIFDVLVGFDGADFEKAIQAAATVEPALFLIWESGGYE